MRSSPAKRVLVIGGGVAGSACAMTLARRGVDVMLIERAEFPRNKVCGCCLGPLGVRALESLGVAEKARSRSEVTARWIGAFDGRRVELTLPHGLAISRSELDPILVDAAQSAGAAFYEQTAARVVEVSEQDVRVSIDDGRRSEDDSFDAVVLASGLNAHGGAGLLPWLEKPSGPFGVSFLAETRDRRLERGAIYIACDSAGYVGLVRLQDGTVDVAAALRHDPAMTRSPTDRINQILRSSGFEFGDLKPLGPVMTAPRLRRRRRAGEGRLIAIGDAAGYVEPFTGEGMTWAMCSGIAAGNLIADIAPQDLGTRWSHLHESELSPRQGICRRIASALESRWKRRVAAGILTTLPSLSKPLLRKMNQQTFGV
ncbi:MAG: NAD(P)/FAD-dependent oxidoreductase, partial [Planctomycetota bacterium]